MKKHIQFLLLIVLIGYPLVDIFSYNINQIPNNSSLSNSAVTCLCQDETGFMLIGTCDGLNFYNSRDVFPFEPRKEVDVLTGSIIDKITYTSDNVFWIQTYYGLNKLDKNTDKVLHYNNFQKLFYMEKDHVGNLFVIQESNSIFYYHQPTDNFKKILLSGLVFSDIISFFIDRNNIIQIITNKGYCQSYEIMQDQSNKHISLHRIENKLHLPTAIRHSFFDDEMLHVIDYNFNLTSYDVLTGESFFVDNLRDELLLRGKVSSIVRFHGNYLIGLQTEGLLMLEKVRNNYVLKPIEVNSGVFCMYKDPLQDIVWIGTDGKGVFSFVNASYIIRSNIVSNLTYNIKRPIRALFLDGSNTLWIGSKGDGILKIADYSINKDLQECNLEVLNTSNGKLHDNIIYAFGASKKDILWIGGEEGLSYYSFSLNTIKKVDLKVLGKPFKYVHDVYETADSKIWIVSVGMGVVCADIIDTGSHITLKNVKHYSVNNGDFESNYFFSIYAENDTTLWFANRGYGVSRYNTITDNLEPFNYYETYSNKIINDVFDVCKDAAGSLFVGTGYGLIKHTFPDQYKIFNTRNGLLNNSIHAIIEENDSVIWCSTNKGLVMFNSRQDNLRVFEKPDGLLISEFSDGAVFKDERTGTLFFGGVNGFVTLKKDEGEDQDYMPEVFFDMLTVFGNRQNIREKLIEYKGSKRLELQYKYNFFSVSFTAIDYINGGNYNYFYKVAELSDIWISNGRTNLVSFSNLAPGNYNLMVKYYNTTLGKESAVYTLPIKIHPPWYLSVWAYIVYYLLFISIVFIVIRVFLTKHNKNKQRLLDDLDKKHQKEVFESKLHFFTSIAHGFCTPLTLISGPCERILSQNDNSAFVNNYTQIIKKNAERLNNLILELIEFQRTETDNRELYVESLNVSKLASEVIEMFSSLTDSNQIDLDFIAESTLFWNVDKGYFTTILTNLISNAYKHTELGNKIKIELEVKGDHLIIQIANQGFPIKETDFKLLFDRYTILESFEAQEFGQRSSQNVLGLAITYNMVKLMKGSIEVVNTMDKFVLFTIKLPSLLINVPFKGVDNLINISYKPEVFHHEIITLPEYIYDQSKPTIFIIAESIELLWLLGELFADEFNVKALQTSFQLEKLMREVSPNVIISEMIMPGQSGIELTRKIKSTKVTAHIPIVLISGNHEIEQQIEALEAGAELYVNKPFDTKTLKLSVVQMIERKEKLKNYFSSPISSYELVEGKLTHKEHKKFLRSVLQIINDNIEGDYLSVHFIADKLGLGTRTLYRKMKEIGEDSLASIITECRLHVAADLLIKTTLTIEEIVYKSGFSNKVTFFKVFRMKYNCTPKHYRTKHEKMVTEYLKE